MTCIVYLYLLNRDLKRSLPGAQPSSPHIETSKVGFLTKLVNILWDIRIDIIINSYLLGLTWFPDGRLMYHQGFFPSTSHPRLNGGKRISQTFHFYIKRQFGHWLHNELHECLSDMGCVPWKKATDSDKNESMKHGHTPITDVRVTANTCDNNWGVIRGATWLHLNPCRAVQWQTISLTDS